MKTTNKMKEMLSKIPKLNRIEIAKRYSRKLINVEEREEQFFRSLPTFRAGKSKTQDSSR